MNTQLSNWIAQVYEATGYLKRLYIGLKDPIQRGRAEAAGAYARERYRTTGRRPNLTAPTWIGLPTEQAERAAWIAVIEGLLGLNLLVALGSASSSKAEPAKLHRRLNQELTSALRGFSAAFPAEFVTQDLHSLCEGVVDQAAGVADGAWQTVRKEGEESVDVRGFLRQEWLRDIRAQIQGLVDSRG
jgi:hypothetical protein